MSLRKVRMGMLMIVRGREAEVVALKVTGNDARNTFLSEPFPYGRVKELKINK